MYLIYKFSVLLFFFPFQFNLVVLGLVPHVHNPLNNRMDYKDRPSNVLLVYTVPKNVALLWLI